MTDEQKQRYKENRSKRNKDKYYNMTDEQKKKMYQKEYRKNMTDEQKQRYKENKNKRQIDEQKPELNNKNENKEIIITIIKD